MKKLKSSLVNMVIVLTVITLCAGAALAFVNDMTRGPIEAINKKNLEDGIRKVLGDDKVAIPAPRTLEDGTVIYETEKGAAVQAHLQHRMLCSGLMTDNLDLCRNTWSCLIPVV